MAMGKYSRVDGKKSSGYGLTITIVLIVSLSLVGAWMFMSSWSAPTEAIHFSPSQTTKDVETTTNTYSTNEEVDRSSKSFPDEKTEETEVVTESNEEKPDPQSSGEKTEQAEEKKEFEDKNGEGDRKDGEGEKDTEPESDETKQKEKTQLEESSEENNGNKTEETTEENTEKKTEETEESTEKSKDVFPAGDQSEITKESSTGKGAWSTQLVESQNEKKAQVSSIKWKVCNVTAGPDYIPCLDNWEAIRKLARKHYEHRERHCPEEAPSCLVSLPEGYKRSIKWPKSREKIWYTNVPHMKLAEVKGHQNWVKMSGEYLTFPGGGTQFKNGALHYIDFLQESYPDIAWGNRTRVILDVGCGVASFGGYLFDRDVLALSFAPKDEHEAQVQFALERGIPAMSNVMGTKRLPFPGSVFDLIHCARCRVPWHIEGGKLLLELNRALRPGGFFVWSATPVYRKDEEDVAIWKAMSKLTKAMCWELKTIKKDELNEVSAAVYQKPMSNECYNQRSQNEPPLCKDSDDQNAAWNVPLEACMHKVAEESTKRGAVWPERWPERVETAPQWLESQEGVYGKPAPEDFTADHERWKTIVSKSYLNGMGIDWSYVRNVMDMRAVYGGFAAALKDLKLWVMNVVPIDSPDTLPIIYERGLFGIYHDWCESFSTYPRTYDLLHADHLFSSLKKRCNLVSVMAEVDRILRPQGTFIVRDDMETIGEIEKMVKCLQWNVKLTQSKDGEGVLSVQKSWWRPTEVETITSAIAKAGEV
ncbi:putative methyltransferase PMT24 [Raphanus sativus]|uniref:Probable methyltransferase PMT24 n=1 Tax=Raphanus sativus TaxID=3726 RepID=A0A6J0JIE6_RAPSA|nr:probable methyltransferase PMT24 [Raphanus sativus]KAJ4916824.1 putative methyltransferase PMT24 [Raphanus sativus]